MTFEQRAGEALRQWMNGPPIDLGKIERFTLWCVLANLQLACRHPGNTGTPMREAHDFAVFLQTEKLELPPELAAIAEMGWQRIFDT